MERLFKISFVACVVTAYEVNGRMNNAIQDPKIMIPVRILPNVCIVHGIKNEKMDGHFLRLS